MPRTSDDRSSESLPLPWSELRDFHRREWAGRVSRLAPMVHNLVPVIGILALDWSSALTLWSLWLDGLVALGLTIALLIHRLRLEPPAISLTTAQFVGTWALFMGFVGIPYYIGLYDQWPMLTDAVGEAFAESRLSVLALAGMVVSTAWSLRGRWHARRDAVPRAGAIGRDMLVHVVRAVAVFTLLSIGVTPLVAVGGLALLYVYLEIFPNTLLMFFVGRPAPGTPLYRWKQQTDLDALFRSSRVDGAKEHPS